METWLTVLQDHNIITIYRKTKIQEGLPFVTSSQSKGSSACAEYSLLTVASSPTAVQLPVIWKKNRQKIRTVTE